MSTWTNKRQSNVTFFSIYWLDLSTKVEYLNLLFRYLILVRKSYHFNKTKGKTLVVVILFCTPCRLQHQNYYNVDWLPTLKIDHGQKVAFARLIDLFSADWKVELESISEMDWMTKANCHSRKTKWRVHYSKCRQVGVILSRGKSMISHDLCSAPYFENYSKNSEAPPSKKI